MGKYYVGTGVQFGGALPFQVPYDGLVAWYDMSQQTPQANLAEMTGLTDFSGNDNHIEFPDLLRTEPLYLDGSQSPNQLSMWFTSRNPGAVRPVTTPLAIPSLVQPCTVFMAWRKGDWSIHGPYFDGYNAGTMAWQEHETAGSGHYQMVADGGTRVGDMNFPDYPKGHWGTFLITCIFDGASSSMQQDQNTPVSGLDCGTAAPGGITIGMYGDQSQACPNAYIMEYQVHQGVPAHLVDIQNEIMARWPAI